jgi:hypothetical protein
VSPISFVSRKCRTIIHCIIISTEVVCRCVKSSSHPLTSLSKNGVLLQLMYAEGYDRLGVGRYGLQLRYDPSSTNSNARWRAKGRQSAREEGSCLSLSKVLMGDGVSVSSNVINRYSRCSGLRSEQSCYYRYTRFIVPPFRCSDWRPMIIRCFEARTAISGHFTCLRVLPVSHGPREPTGSTDVKHIKISVPPSYIGFDKLEQRKYD